MQQHLIEEFWPDAAATVREKQSTMVINFQGMRIAIAPSENEYGFIAHRYPTCEVFKTS